MKGIQKAVTSLNKALDEAESARNQIVEFLENYPMSKREKEKLFGWGKNNFNKTLYGKNYRVTTHRLLRAAEELIKMESIK